MPQSIFSQNIKEIKKFYKKHKKIILKPIHSFSGNDIHLLTKFNTKSQISLNPSDFNDEHIRTSIS